MNISSCLMAIEWFSRRIVSPGKRGGDGRHGRRPPWEEDA